MTTKPTRGAEAAARRLVRVAPDLLAACLREQDGIARLVWLRALLQDVEARTPATVDYPALAAAQDLYAELESACARFAEVAP